MGETGMVSGSETQGRAMGKEKKVDITQAGREPVTTDRAPKPGQMYVVRAAKGEQKVTVQVDTDRITERSKIKAANDSVRRRTRG